MVVIAPNAFAGVKSITGLAEVERVFPVDVIMISAVDVHTACKVVVVFGGVAVVVFGVVFVVVSAEGEDAGTVDFPDGKTDVIPIGFVEIVDVAVVFPLLDDLRTVGIIIAATITRLITTVAVANIFFFFLFLRHVKNTMIFSSSQI